MANPELHYVPKVNAFEEVARVKDSGSAAEFLTRNFVFGFAPNYIEEVQEEAKQRPHRDENPSYWRLLGLMGIEAARYGFPEASGHLITHIKSQFHGGQPLDRFHPLYLLSSLAYLGSLNKQAHSKKLGIIEHWEEVQGPDPKTEEKVWGSFSPAHGGQVEFPPASEFFTRGALPLVFTRRLIANLPVYIPDSEVYGPLSATGFSRKDIEVMDDGQDNDLLVRKFGPVLSNQGIDLESVLFNKSETWRPPTRYSRPRIVELRENLAQKL